MSGSLVNISGHILFIIMGICFVIYHKRLGSMARKFQSEKFRINADEKWYSIGYFICGVAFIILGSIEILKVFKF